MNHKEARLLIGAEPHSAPTPELAAHLTTCAGCAQFRHEMITLDCNIRRALEHGPLAAAPETAPIASVTQISSARAARQAKPSSWSGWAWAASAAVASVLVIWALRPNDTLAHDLVTHVESESDSWSSDHTVPLTTTNSILAKAGVTLDMSSGKVIYARNCLFRGHVVPHLVVTTSRGPVTVLVLPHETVTQRTTFHEDGVTGVITPAPRGSVAILALGSESVDAAAQEVQHSVRWLSQP